MYAVANTTSNTASFLQVRLPFSLSFFRPFLLSTPFFCFLFSSLFIFIAGCHDAAASFSSLPLSTAERAILRSLSGSFFFFAVVVGTATTCTSITTTATSAALLFFRFSFLPFFPSPPASTGLPAEPRHGHLCLARRRGCRREAMRRRLTEIDGLAIGAPTLPSQEKKERGAGAEWGAVA